MTDGTSGPIERPATSHGHWQGFVSAAAHQDGPVKSLQEKGNPQHRVRVEFDGHTVFVHLSDEHGAGWTSLAVDRASREWSVAQRDTQSDAAAAAVLALYDDR